MDRAGTSRPRGGLARRIGGLAQVVEDLDLERLIALGEERLPSAGGRTLRSNLWSAATDSAMRFSMRSRSSGVSARGSSKS
jgi:hypothetical protein